jgi:NADH-quinone oxidoreductase subunit L
MIAKRSILLLDWPVVGDHADLHLSVHRRDGQVGPGAAARVAAGFDGRPDADLGADPRRHDGHGRHLHGGAHVAAVRAVRDGAVVVLVIGATTALFMGFLGVVNNDIKRVVAYSTLSQLGYMTVALGASAYSAGDLPPDDPRLLQGAAVPRRGLGDHRHAPRAGHAQDGRPLKKYLPITYWTSLIGTLALIGFPVFSGFFRRISSSRRSVHASPPGAHTYAYWCVLIGVFVTALYSFRMRFRLTCSTARRRSAHDHHAKEHSHARTRPPMVVWHAPGSLLADPSRSVDLHRLADDRPRCVFGSYFGDAIFVIAKCNDVLAEIAAELPRARRSSCCTHCHACRSGSRVGRCVCAWFLYLKNPDLPPVIGCACSSCHLHGADQQVLLR